MLDVLLVEDDEDVRMSVADALLGAGHHVTEAGDGESAGELIGASRFDLVICDVHIPRGNGISLFRRIRRDAPGTSVVIMTGFGHIPDAVGALRDGAVDYVTKPFDPEELMRTVVEPIAERCALRRRVEEARASIVAKHAGGRLVGTSAAMRALVDRVGVAAQSDAPTLVTGEEGTGKDVVARIVHAESARRDGPFVVVPCDAIADLLRRSPDDDTDASRAPHDDWFRSAEHGTLVLDGIEALAPDAQAGLLRLIEAPTLLARRDADWQPLGVRLVATTREAPSPGLAIRDFLEPLYYRLSAIRLHVPPVRERVGDLCALVLDVLRDVTPRGSTTHTLTSRAWNALARHPFPGNVRELTWALSHATAIARGRPIDVDDLPEKVRARA